VLHGNERKELREMLTKRCFDVQDGLWSRIDGFVVLMDWRRIPGFLGITFVQMTCVRGRSHGLWTKDAIIASFVVWEGLLMGKGIHRHPIWPLKDGISRTWLCPTVYRSQKKTVCLDSRFYLKLQPSNTAGNICKNTTEREDQQPAACPSQNVGRMTWNYQSSRSKIKPRALSFWSRLLMGSPDRLTWASILAAPLIKENTMTRKIGIITYNLGFIWKIPIIRCMAPPFNVGDLILITGLWQVLRLQAMQNQWHEREGSQLEWILKDCFLSINRSIAIQFLSEKSLMPEI
jgi:hypothetical protein